MRGSRNRRRGGGGGLGRSVVGKKKKVKRRSSGGGGASAPPPPGKSQVIWGSIGIRPSEPSLEKVGPLTCKKLDPLPNLEN